MNTLNGNQLKQYIYEHHLISYVLERIGCTDIETYNRDGKKYWRCTNAKSKDINSPQPASKAIVISNDSYMRTWDNANKSYWESTYTKNGKQPDIYALIQYDAKLLFDDGNCDFRKAYSWLSNIVQESDNIGIVETIEGQSTLSAPQQKTEESVYGLYHFIQYAEDQERGIKNQNPMSKKPDLIVFESRESVDKLASWHLKDRGVAVGGRRFSDGHIRLIYETAKRFNVAIIIAMNGDASEDEVKAICARFPSDARIKYTTNITTSGEPYMQADQSPTDLWYASCRAMIHNAEVYHRGGSKEISLDWMDVDKSKSNTHEMDRYK